MVKISNAIGKSVAPKTGTQEITPLIVLSMEFYHGKSRNESPSFLVSRLELGHKNFASARQPNPQYGRLF